MVFKRRTFKKRRFGGRRQFGGRRKILRRYGRRRFKPSRIVNKRPGIIADRYYTKLSYISHQNITSTGGISVLDFRGNGPFDPEVAVGGGQPFGFDQLSALYNQVLVFGSKILINCSVYNAAAPQSNKNDMVFTLRPSRDLTPATDVDIEWGNPYGQMKVLGAYKPTVFKSFMSTAKIYGVPPKKVTDEEDFSSSIGALPANGWVWHFSTISADGTTTTIAHLRIRITYYCCFYERQTLPFS